MKVSMVLVTDLNASSGQISVYEQGQLDEAMKRYGTSE